MVFAPASKNIKLGNSTGSGEFVIQKQQNENTASSGLKIKGQDADGVDSNNVGLDGGDVTIEGGDGATDGGGGSKGNVNIIGTLKLNNLNVRTGTMSNSVINTNRNVIGRPMTIHG